MPQVYRFRRRADRHEQVDTAMSLTASAGFSTISNELGGHLVDHPDLSSGGSA